MTERESARRKNFGAIGATTSRLLNFLQTRSRTWLLTASFALLVIVGIADYFAGFERSVLVFYLLPVSLAAWFVSWRFAITISLLGIAGWIGGDIAAGATYSSWAVPFWNATAAAASFLVVIWLLQKLRSLLQGLEDRVRQATAALREEMKVRERLEKDVTEAAERERQRIGHELHDSLGQHLTATSLALQVLRGKLAAESSSRSKEVDQTVELVEQGIDLTRKIAKGLFPLELEGEGLAAALVELSRVTTQNHHVACELKCESPVGLSDSAIATHLYRIAQEAVVNAVKHGHVSRIVIELSRADGNLTLAIKDDGVGLPTPLPENRGIGLRIMSSRAAMIGGTLSIRNELGGGAVVVCDLPAASNDGSANFSEAKGKSVGI